MLRRLPPPNRRSLRLLAALVLSLLLAAPPLGAQAAEPTPEVTNSASGVVRGTIWDSLARRALPGATVQLVLADAPERGARSVVADAAGRFAFDAVPDGRYHIAFFHPLLDSLGLGPTPREARVTRGRQITVSLATPSPARVRDAVCPGVPAVAADGDTNAVVLGVVRSARELQPLADARVLAQWTEITFAREGVRSSLARREVTTGPSGRFALCDAPASGQIQLVARAGEDSTARLDLQIPPTALVRRDLVLGVREGGTGAAGAVVTARLTGSVTTADGRPLAGAQVRVAGGAATRTDDNGGWTLGAVPAGSRMLEVRQVGYYPERRPVDVVADAPPVAVQLATLGSVLDTVRITARRMRPRHDMRAFEERRRSTAGRFLTAAEIERRGAWQITDILRMIPGIRVDGFGLDMSLLMRSAFGPCIPTYYVDGMLMPWLMATDLDGMLNPKYLAGLEIYQVGMAPAEFTDYTREVPCGSIVIWTK